MTIPIEHPRLRGYTPLDIITGIYFALTGIILAVGMHRIPNGLEYLLLHIGIVAAVALLGAVPRRGHVVLMFFRDTYTLWALPFIYKEVGVLNGLIWSRFFDGVVIRWELALFGNFPSLFLRDILPNRILDEFLHFSYLTYYILLPILGLWLYLRGREELTRVVATSMMLTFSVCYLTFIAFPVVGPYYVFIQDKIGTGIFPPLVHIMLAGGSSRGAAFPSSHVAGAVTIFWMTVRFERPLIPLIGLLTAGIFFGTVYGGFHYAVDAFAGVGVGVVCSLAGPRLHSWLLRRSRLGPLKIRFPHLFDPLVATLRRSRRRLRDPHID